MDLDEVADELYAVPPDEFVAVRTQRQEDARAAGDRTLAREVGALPKPTAAASSRSTRPTLPRRRWPAARWPP